MDGFGFGDGNAGTSVLTLEIGDDGSVELTAPAVHTSSPASTDFDANLAENDGLDLAGIVNELAEGLSQDEQSRLGFIQQYVDGIDLLGLDVKRDSSDDKVSKVGHPLLLEAVIQGQAAAGAELMPADGPVKVEQKSDVPEQDEIARAFQDDLNWYLTKGAPEYYPDMERLLFTTFYSGNGFRKVYWHPLRRRPVADSIGINDLIVDNAATDLLTALRVTHRSEMSLNQIKRMQHFSDWLECDLSTNAAQVNATAQAEAQVHGISRTTSRPQDAAYEVLETTVDLDLRNYGMTDKIGRKTVPELPLTYIVTWERNSRQVLAIRRGWQQNDETFQRKPRFVHYGMIPAFQFLNLGFVHLLGNQTKVLRAIWRALTTQGMYANMPGGFKVKGVRHTGDIRPGPGEWVDVDIGAADDIRSALMAMPYKDVSESFTALGESIKAEAMKLVGLSQVELGEGRANMPVGTIMSIIEVATRTMSAVHKRLHRAQAQELQMIRQVFVEHPDALNKLNPRAKRQWSTADEFADLDLSPQSDPNVPSQVHRIQMAAAMVQVAAMNPDLYDRPKLHRKVWEDLNVPDVDEFVLAQPIPQPPAAGGAAPPDPQIGQAKLMEAQVKMQQAGFDQQDMQRKAAMEAGEQQQQGAKIQMEAQAKAAELASREKIAAMQIQIEQLRLQAEQARESNQHAHEIQQTQMEHHARASETAQQLDLQREQHAGETDLQREKMAADADVKRHIAGVQAKTATSVAKMRPAPKPTTTKPAGKK